MGGGAIKEDVMARHRACMSEIRNAYKILVRKIEDQRPLVRKR
jgi:hypothetical protein